MHDYINMIELNNFLCYCYLLSLINHAETRFFSMPREAGTLTICAVHKLINTEEHEGLLM